MEIPKMKKGIYAHLPEVLNVVKLNSIAREMGVSQAWVSNRLHRHKSCQYYTRHFSQPDVALVNQGLWRLGEKLMQVQLSHSADRDTLSAAVKQAFSDVFIYSFIGGRLGMTESQVKMRLLTGPTATRRPTFSPEEIENLVMGVREVGLQLLSTEFFLDEN